MFATFVYRSCKLFSPFDVPMSLSFTDGRDQISMYQVVQGLANVSRSLLQVGLPFTVHWTHLEATYHTSALTFTLGHCFYFRASIGDGHGVLVDALPGLQNHVDQRSVELKSAQGLQDFLLGEVCRQIVLTFGDITMAWTSTSQPEASCFRVDLVPAAIHLSPPPKAKSAREVVTEDSSWSCFEVRVFAQKVGCAVEKPCG